MEQIVLNGNNIDLLKEYPNNYFDAVVTDPPYGLGKEPNAEEVMKGWVDKGYHEVGGSGFMGKEWDAFIPQPIFWKEVFRVLKHGGHVVSFFGTRTYDWGVMSMRFAGFEVRDCIQWLYGSGFPKSHNISKAIDKLHGAEREVIGEKIRLGDKKSYSYKETEDYVTMGKQYSQRLETKASTEDAKEWDGWGSALKPANEPIVLARKPLEKGLSIAENVLKWGTGGINIDASRIGFKDDADFKESTQKNQPADFGTKPMTNNNVYGDYSMVQPKNYEPTGRFPANIILTHHPECECKGTKKVKPSNGSGKASEKGGGFSKGMFGDGTSDNIGGGFTDAEGNETIENWDCHEDCPIRILDEQSGVTKSQRSERGNIIDNNVYGKYKEQENTLRGHSDKGGASRFFYCAKASKSERNNGLDGFEQKIIEGRDEGQDDRSVAYKPRPNPMANIHPTVKPVKLMQYLARLITPPNGKVLDPFCGSGTTGIACKLEGFEFVGMEQDAEYTKIAQARIDNYQEEPLEPLELIQEDSKGNTITQTSLF